MQNLSQPQFIALQEFKQQVVLLDRDNKDVACLRFLRARNYDVLKSVEMYNNYKKWRAENYVDNILHESHPVDRSKWPRSFHGVDKMGRPILIERIGCVDVKHLMEREHLDVQKLLRGHIRTQEYLCALHEECSLKAGRLIETSITILDLEGCGLLKHLNSHAREYFGSLAAIGQNYYPERMGRMLVINAPRAFPMAWSFVKSLLDRNTQDKIEVLSPHHSRQRLLELIDPQYLPKYMGGACDCDAKKCFLTDISPCSVSLIFQNLQHSHLFNV